MKYKYKYKGYIRYFDNISGRGVISIRSIKNENVKFDVNVHYSADSRYKGRYSVINRYKYENHTPIECNIYFDSHFTQVEKFKISNYCTREDVLSDIILSILECPSPNDDFFLNNFISK